MNKTFRGLKIVTLAIVTLLAALTLCRAQNGLMLTTVADFQGPYYSSPIGQLVQGNDGALYGSLALGGTNELGAIFKATLTGSLTTFVSFNGTNGVAPQATPILAPDGYFYGTTAAGGSNYNASQPDNQYYGTIYRMDSNGVVTTLFSFDQTNGASPMMGLVLGNDGSFYGVAGIGGPNFTNSNEGDGTIFKITTNGDFTLVARFNGTNGYGPHWLIQASDGNFYGITESGGIDDSNRFGAVFRMTPDGQLTNLVVFNGTNGCGPDSIMQASDGCLYGTTGYGGAFYTGNPGSGYGTVFKVTTNGDFTMLASFSETNGAFPLGLTEVSNGLFYGTTYGGGENSDGTLFQVSINEDFAELLAFGASPALPGNPIGGPLAKASDGNYYGLSSGPDFGTIFSIRPIQAPVLQPIAQGSQLNLIWNAWAGYSYNVMYETNLTGSNWTLLSTITPQTNGPASYSDNLEPDAQRFYQVILQLP